MTDTVTRAFKMEEVRSMTSMISQISLKLLVIFSVVEECLAAVDEVRGHKKGETYSAKCLFP